MEVKAVRVKRHKLYRWMFYFDASIAKLQDTLPMLVKIVDALLIDRPAFANKQVEVSYVAFNDSHPT